MTKEELERLYIEENMSRRDLAELCGISESDLKTLLSKYGIKKPRSAVKIHNYNTKVVAPAEAKGLTYDDIYDAYYGQHNTLAKTGDMLGLTYGQITYLLDKFNIPLKSAKQVSEDRLFNTAKTNLERYGVEYTVQRADVKAKTQETMIERYGVAVPLQNEAIKKKMIETNNEKHGCDYVGQSAVVRERVESTMMDRYGAKYPLQVESFLQKAQKTMTDRYGVKCSSLSPELKAKMVETNLQTYGVPYACMRQEAHVACPISGPNKAFAALLESKGIQYEREFKIENRYYDFKVGDTLIEIDPTATHNSSWSPFGGEPLSKTYHAEKSKLANLHNHRCIHVFDWDNKDALVEMLLPRERLAARQCELKEVDRQSAVAFINEHHLQGYAKDSVRLGLFYNEELVSIMTFGKPRYNKNYEWELVRYCSSYSIVGGAERLFTNFVKMHKPSSVLSYCDMSKFEGKTYEKLGFKLLRASKSNRHWAQLDGTRHVTDNLLRQRGFDQLFGASFGRGTSNEELMIMHGFVEVYDCGQATYVCTFQ